MTDQLLNNVRDLLTGATGLPISASFNVHSVDDAAAAEIVAHLDEGWYWRADSSGFSSQWLTGSHRESGTSIILFLVTERRVEDHTARGKAILAKARG